MCFYSVLAVLPISAAALLEITSPLGGGREENILAVPFVFPDKDFFKRKIAIFQRRRGGLVYIQDEAVCYKSRRLDCRKIGGDLRINVSAVKNTSRLKDYQCDKVLLHTRKCSRKDDFRTRQSLVTKSRLCCWTCRKIINI